MNTVYYRLMLAALFLGPALPVMSQVPVWNESINVTNLDVRTATETLAEITITAPENGTVLIHFDGHAFPDVGDRLILAASDTPTWSPNDGNVSFEIINGDINAQSFSHTRSYTVAAGTHTFYAVAQNSVEQDGDGMASIYGNLTVKFFADGATDAAAFHQDINETNTNVRGDAVVLAEQAITVAEAGKVLVRFDGLCIPDVGDRIVLAASDMPDWSVNDGNTTCAAMDADVNQASFSHSRVYDVDAGTHSFYAVAENFVEQNGDGLASIYASLTVEFYPEPSTGPFLFHQGINETNIDVRTAQVPLGQISVEAPLPGKVIVHFDGGGYPDAADRLILAASNTPSWSANDGNVQVELNGGNRNTAAFSHTRVYDIDAAGSYDFYAVANNAVEEDGNGTASVYGSLTVQYFPDLSRVSVEDAPEAAVQPFTLEQNYPNPFSRQTAIRYSLDAPAQTTMTIYNLIGQEVKRFDARTLPSGAYEFVWDGLDNAGRPVPNGVYLYTLTAGEAGQTRQLIRVR